MEEAQSQLEADKTNLSYTKIYATMDGTIVDQLVQEGQTINANQTTPTIVQIANLDIMTANEVAEADVMKLKVGVPMYFTTLGSGGRRWEGKVRQILPTPEEINDVVLYNVLVDVGNDDHVLLPGMTTQTFFVLASAEDVPLIPVSALGNRVPEEDNEKGQAYEVYVMKPSGPVAKTVIVGLSDRTQAAVVEGLRRRGPHSRECQSRPRRGRGAGVCP
ncbi:MAG: efflux RND transporter periplasmic adaptor subunit [Thermodesulfobacteriota bacterium]